MFAVISNTITMDVKWIVKKHKNLVISDVDYCQNKSFDQAMEFLSN